MPSSRPEAALWLSVPDNCRMRGEFEVGDRTLPDVHILLGSNGDDKHLLFEREALVRFVALAQRMLAIPVSPDSRIPRTLLESRHGHEIKTLSRAVNNPALRATLPVPFG